MLFTTVNVQWRCQRDGAGLFKVSPTRKDGSARGKNIPSILCNSTFCIYSLIRFGRSIYIYIHDISAVFATAILQKQLKWAILFAAFRREAPNPLETPSVVKCSSAESFWLYSPILLFSRVPRLLLDRLHKVTRPKLSFWLRRHIYT